MSFTIDLSNPVVYNSLLFISIPVFAILFFVYYSFIYSIFRNVISFFIKDDDDIKMLGNNISLAVIIFEILFLAKIIFWVILK